MPFPLVLFIPLNPEEPKKGTILLVDDLPENLQLLSNLLIEGHYDVRSVSSGRMALKTLKAKQVDVILLDLKMPEMDGYQVCQAIKADDNLKEIPVIFLSALDETFDKVKAFAYGGVDYITKPFQIEEVIARLENQLTIKRQQYSLQQEIKKRKEAEAILCQSRALLVSVLNTSLDGIAALQAIREIHTGQIVDFRCLVVNPVIARAFKKTRESMMGQLILQELLVEFDSNLLERLIQVVETGDPLEDDFYYPIDNSCWYHCVAVKLGDGFAVTVRDITARKKIELELKEANQKLELLANLDGLTQIANRRRFDNCLLQEWANHLLTNQSLSLILIDIDHFKAYNDLYGHQIGDHCLIQVAQTLAKIFPRTEDLVARYGGEEFAVILPKTDIDRSVTLAEMIKQAIAELEIPHAQSLVSPYITLSLGVASLIPDGRNSLYDLICQADKALYQAKQEGRDRLVIYS